MNKVVSLLLIVAVFCCSAFAALFNFTANSEDSSHTVTYHYYNNDKHYFFNDNNYAYYVSTSGTNVLINKIGVEIRTLKFDSEVINCNYVNGEFYFLLRNKEKFMTAASYNYSKKSSRNYKFADFKNNNKFLFVPDNKGNFYTVNETNKYELLKFSSDGKLINRYKLPDYIAQLVTYNGSDLLIVTGRECYSFIGTKLKTVSSEHWGYPLTMLNSQYITKSGNIYDLKNNCKKIFSSKSSLVAVCGKYALTASGKNISLTPIGKNKPTKEYYVNDVIVGIYAGNSTVYAVTKQQINVIKISDFSKIIYSDNASQKNTDDYGIDTENTLSTTENSGGNSTKISSPTYKLSDGYINNVSGSTSITVFKNTLNFYGYEISFSENGVTRTQGYVKTGMKVNFTAGNSSIKYTIIVNGDVNSDGKVNTKDTQKFTDYLLGNVKLNNSEKLSADTNSDNKLSNADLVRMARLRN
ncbi:MAG: dockerin type I repeat-containing protein [Ruminococcus sp.]|nr:dockerin type I repeat-containing protein [Ruminococcus sp.]